MRPKKPQFPSRSGHFGRTTTQSFLNPSGQRPMFLESKKIMTDLKCEQRLFFPPRMKKIPCSPLNRHWFITKTLRDHHGNNLTQTSCEILWSNVSPEQIFHCWHALKFDSSPVSLLALNVPQIHHGVLPYITVSTGEVTVSQES